MTRDVTVEERRSRLARRHRLVAEDRTDDVAAIADSLVALHSSDPVTVYLSAAARLRHPSLAAVDKALYDDRSVVRHHAMRRTLWVATPEVARLMHATASRRLIAPERRRMVRLLSDNGIADPEGWLADARAQVLATLEQHGPMSARALGEKVPALRHKIVMSPGKSYSATVSAHTRVLLCLGFEGAVMRGRPTGSWVNSAYTYAATDAWLPGGLGELDEREAARELAHRWLVAFGPGTAADLQWWTGWTAGTTTQALRDGEAVEVRVDGAPAYLAAGDEAEPEPTGPWVAVLPGLDPTTMGWKEREWYLPAHAAGAFDRMGNAGPTIWADGRVVGVWDQAADGRLLSHFFEEPAGFVREAVAERLAVLAELVGDSRFTVRFPSPVSTALRNSTPPAV